METSFKYGSNVVVDTVIMRLRLGYKYYWEYGFEVDEADRMCRVCGGIGSHTLAHFVLHCPPLQQFRNNNIDNVTEQIIWMLNNGRIEKIVKNFKNFAPRV